MMMSHTLSGIDDPGVKGQIFEGMRQNDQKLMEVNGDFLTVHPMIKCDSHWQEELHYNLDSVIRSKIKNSLIGYHSSLGKNLQIPYRPRLTIPITVIFQLPTFFSRSSSLDNNVDLVKDFFKLDQGTISVSRASCTTHRVDVALGRENL